MTIEVTVPDIGDFTDIPVVTVLVSVGDTVAVEDPIVELESDKATMEVPSSAAGVVKEIKVSEGDNVSKGSLILILEGEGAAIAPAEAAAPAAAPVATAPVAAPALAAAAVTDAGFGKAHASPSVRAFARNLDVDLAKVNGTG
ncbi:MAG: biotin/lipoyl-containing protein, partial [Planktotalea arctica]